MNTDKSPLFNGSGEMHDFYREKDWSTTAVGNPDIWPQSLTTLISLLLNSKFPMFLFWGDELTCFYNDAYRPSLGQNGKHPAMLGEPASIHWAEIWDEKNPIIQQILQGGEAFFIENHLLEIYRNNQLENAYWSYCYSAVTNETGNINGVFVTCTETTENIINLKKFEYSKQQLEFAMEAAGIATWDLNPLTNKFTGNKMLKDWHGLNEDESFDLVASFNHVKENDRPLLIAAIENALDFNKKANMDVTYTITQPYTKQTRIVRARAKTTFDVNNIAIRLDGILQDVTDDVLTTLKIEESEKQFKAMAEVTDVLTAVGDETSNAIYFNNAWVKLTGRSMSDLLKFGWADLIHNEDRDKYVNIYLTAFKNKSPFTGEFRILSKEGSYKWLFAQGMARFYPNGEFAGYISSCVDITELNTARKQAEENEQRLNSVIEAGELATWELNIKTNIVIYSGKYALFFGRKDDEYIKREEIGEMVHPDDVSIRNKALEDSFTTGNLRYEIRYIWPDKTIHWLQAKGKVFYDDENKPKTILGILREITDEKNHENELEENEAKFRLLADSMPQLVWTGDANGVINYYNNSVYTYSGLSPEELFEKGWQSIVHPDEREENINHWKKSILTGTDYLYEHRFKKHTGEYRWQLSRAIPQRDKEGNIQMWVGTSTDIEEQKIFTSELKKQVAESTAALKEKNINLELMNKELQSFAYISSHDLQEPLRKIQTFSSQIVATDYDNLSVTGRDRFKRMQLAAARMQNLIEDLLAYSRTNTAEKKIEYLELSDIFNDVYNDLEEEILQKKASVSLIHNCSLTVIPFQFRQLLYNLLSNSLKFFNAGNPPQITVTGSVTIGDTFINKNLKPNLTYSKITVSDNGIGFDPIYKDKIFEVFQRLHSKAAFDGTGIGLAIVKKIIENHDGIIVADAIPREGAIFTIFLPFLDK